ncbi:dual specificity protein phosphatase 8-like [Protopterus annectens]|uniref:dual specificity protein phosphatase 8-like n=1 Tax=Protopterus annectens TaxID=7888 RepID=UPI001CFB4BF3|nr:dual specificity protein phosphatase 8-like [Protopterus annectens]
MGGDKKTPRAIGAQQLAGILRHRSEEVLVVDCRTFTEYNTLHIIKSINVCCSKLLKRRLQQDKVTVRELLQSNSKADTSSEKHVIVYDQGTQEFCTGEFVSVVLGKLEKYFSCISFLEGGFGAFSSQYPNLCEGKSAIVFQSSISQPCLSTANIALTRIFPYLYLGSQNDVLNKDVMAENGITHVLNVSNSCPKPAYIPETHFLRIPVNDSYCEKILPWLNKAVDFIDKAKLLNGRVLVHCLAGISRSAAIAIAYVMRTLGLSLDDAYRYVKERRPSVSPNFNFLGQLLEYEMTLDLNLPPAFLTHSLSHTYSLLDRRPPEHKCVWEHKGVGGPSHFMQTSFKVEDTDNSAEVEVALDGSKVAEDCEEGSSGVKSLENKLCSLKVSEQSPDPISMKRSFSLDIRSVYTSSSSTVLDRHTGFYHTAKPAETGPASKLFGFRNRIFGFGLNLFSMFTDNTKTAELPTVRDDEQASGQLWCTMQASSNHSRLAPSVCAAKVDQTRTTSDHQITHVRVVAEESPRQPFVLSMPSCKQQGLFSRDNHSDIVNPQRTVSPLPL